jgi:hypothetical protein
MPEIRMASGLYIRALQFSSCNINAFGIHVAFVSRPRNNRGHGKTLNKMARPSPAPAPYLGAWARLQYQKPMAVSAEEWRRAIDAAGRFLDAVGPGPRRRIPMDAGRVV